MATQPFLPAAELLLLEDDPAEGGLLRLAFTASPPPASLQLVSSVDQALAFLRHTGPEYQVPHPQLIVTPLKLPHRPGLELVAELKGDPALRRIPEVILTGNEDPALRRHSAALGADGYFLKPLELDALCAVAQAIKTQWVTGLPVPASHGSPLSGSIPGTRAEPVQQRHEGTGKRPSATPGAMVQPPAGPHPYGSAWEIGARAKSTAQRRVAERSRPLALLLTGLWLASCAPDPERAQACQRAIYGAHDQADYEARGLGEVANRALGDCLAGADPPETYARRAFSQSLTPP